MYKNTFLNCVIAEGEQNEEWGNVVLDGDWAGQKTSYVYNV